MTDFNSKNKFQSQQIHKYFKNRHRSNKKVFQSKTTSTRVFETTDIERIVRDCRGLSTSDLVAIDFDFDFYRENDDWHQADHDNTNSFVETSQTAQPTECKDESTFSLLDFEWECELCTFVNWPDAVECEMCGAWSWKINLEAEPESTPRDSIVPVSFSFETVSPTKRKHIPVSIVTLEYLTPVRKPASKAQKRQEQLDKEHAARKKGKPCRKVAGKSVPVRMRYPREIVDALPSPSSLAGLRGKPTHVELLPVPDRLKASVQLATTALQTNSTNFKGLAFHGTDEKNTDSIISKGLLVGGPETVRKHGAAHGQGVYCSDRIETAQCYARGTSAPVFACLVLEEANTFGAIYVVPKSTKILPVYLLCFGSPYRGFSNKIPVAMDHHIRIMNARKGRWFVPPVDNNGSSNRSEMDYKSILSMSGAYLNGRINPCDPTRRSRRKWPS